MDGSIFFLLVFFSFNWSAKAAGFVTETMVGNLQTNLAQNVSAKCSLKLFNPLTLCCHPGANLNQTAKNKASIQFDIVPYESEIDATDAYELMANSTCCLDVQILKCVSKQIHKEESCKSEKTKKVLDGWRGQVEGDMKKATGCTVEQCKDKDKGDKGKGHSDGFDEEGNVRLLLFTASLALFGVLFPNV